MKKPGKPTKPKKPQHSPDTVFSFTLTKRQVADILNENVLAADLFAGGSKQEDGSVRFNMALDEIEEALELLAAACNHAEDPKVEARLDTIYRKLEKLVE